MPFTQRKFALRDRTKQLACGQTHDHFPNGVCYGGVEGVDETPHDKVEGGARLSGRDLVNSQFGGMHPVLREPNQLAEPLAPIDQFTLNALARQLSRNRETRSVAVPAARKSDSVRVRWWALNRFDPSCAHLVTVSNPVVLRDTAFVSVTSGHWGTTYALRRTGGAWRPTAQWAGWLY